MADTGDLAKEIKVPAWFVILIMLASPVLSTGVGILFNNDSLSKMHEQRISNNEQRLDQMRLQMEALRERIDAQGGTTSIAISNAVDKLMAKFEQYEQGQGARSRAIEDRVTDMITRIAELTVRVNQLSNVIIPDSRGYDSHPSTFQTRKPTG